MKILYVEDNAVNLSLIQRIAQMNQHELISFEDAETALDFLGKGEQVDLILLDIQLAGEMDGIDFAKALRARGDRKPIIAITAYAMMGDKERIIQAGCNEYLPKPLPIAEFLTLLAKYDPAVYKMPEAEKPAEAAPAAPVQATPPPVASAPETPQPAAATSTSAPAAPEAATPASPATSTPITPPAAEAPPPAPSSEVKTQEPVAASNQEESKG